MSCTLRERCSNFDVYTTATVHCDGYSRGTLSVACQYLLANPDKQALLLNFIQLSGFFVVNLEIDLYIDNR